jgi:uncharacterized membrane protein
VSQNGAQPSSKRLRLCLLLKNSFFSSLTKTISLSLSFFLSQNVTVMSEKINTLQEASQFFSDKWTSRLLQLDKNLRASDIGKQCEAIVQMGNLMREYPFPQMVNTILLKLADVFSDWCLLTFFLFILVFEFTVTIVLSDDFYDKMEEILIDIDIVILLEPVPILFGGVYCTA